MRPLAAILFLTLLAGSGGDAAAQGRYRGTDRDRSQYGPNFHADVAVLPVKGGDPRLEVFVSIPLGILGAEDVGQGPKGRASVLVILYNSDGDQITGDEWSYHDIPLGRTARENRGRMLNRRYSFRLPPGKVEAKIQVVDEVRDRRGTRWIEFEIPDFSRKDIELSSPVYGIDRGKVSRAPEDAFYGSLLPHPSRRFGNDVPGPSVLFHLRDDLDTAGDYAISYKVKSSFGEVMEDSTFSRPRGGGVPRRVLIVTQNSRLATGSYTFELEVRVGKKSAKSRSVFTVDESRMTFQRDPDKLRTIMKYVATNREKVRLEEVPDDSLGGFWDGFWARRDPDQSTVDNEALIQFLERVEYATQRFGVLEPGWRSDRGRIYIKYGPPDQVEEFYSETHRYPTLIWYYYNRGRNYVFQDQEGFGRYRLVGMQEE